ncbi:MAG: Tol-Pal system beta propeller repeat protein TolB [Gammaproteobacteria bacterium]|nr:Tol-Pal system beta propeller repeat protein TolB [Gammaproteobacteria bacterium]
MNQLINKSAVLLLLALCGVVFTAQAQVSIDISGGTVRGKPIAIVPFRTIDGTAPGTQIDQVIANNLKISGKFEPISANNYMSFPSRSEEVRFKDWRFIDAEALVIGEIWKLDTDLYEVQFRVYDVARELEVGQGKRIPNLRGKDLRTAAHIISDSVYQAFMNKPGAFNSRIAFIKRSEIEFQRFRYRLMVADWDGFGEQEVFASWRPLLSPAWSPDGRRLSFVSFADTGSVIRVLDTTTGQHEIVAQFKGVNSAPAWSPDGRQLAYSTSQNGSPDIYVYDVNSKQHTRISTHYGIDTEPAWSPDGRSLLFTSNRSGKPQIYSYDFARQESTRITFDGDENANASYDYNGERVALVHDGGQIAVMQERTGELTWITRNKFDESPSFSPNGDMVLYASEQDYEPALMVASSDGRVRTKLEFVQGDVREPSWSPLRQ